MKTPTILVVLMAGAGGFACGSSDAEPASEGVAGSDVDGTGGGDIGVAGANSTTVGGNGGSRIEGAGGATSGSGGAGGSMQIGGSTNHGGSSSAGGGGGGGSSGGAGSSVNMGGGGSGGAGAIWYDGEPGGVPYAAGMGALSAGSTASETTDNPHAGTKSLHISLNGAQQWGHWGWSPSLDHKVFDLSTHTTMQYWIRTASGTSTTLQMEMHGPGGGCPWINVKDYLPGGATTTWQKVTIPLSAFKIDLKRIQVVDFWLSSGSADFFIDDAGWN